MPNSALLLAWLYKIYFLSVWVSSSVKRRYKRYSFQSFDCVSKTQEGKIPQQDNRAGRGREVGCSLCQTNAAAPRLGLVGGPTVAEVPFPPEHLAAVLAVRDQAPVEVSQPVPHPSRLTETAFLKAWTNTESRTEEKQKTRVLSTHLITTFILILNISSMQQEWEPGGLGEWVWVRVGGTFHPTEKADLKHSKETQLLTQSQGLLVNKDCSSGPCLLSPGALLSLASRSFLPGCSQLVPLVLRVLPNPSKLLILMPASGHCLTPLILVCSSPFCRACDPLTCSFTACWPGSQESASLRPPSTLPAGYFFHHVVGAGNFLGSDLFGFGPRTGRLDSWWAGGMVLGSVSFLFLFQAEGEKAVSMTLLLPTFGQIYWLLEE